MRGDLIGTHRQQVFLHEAMHAMLDTASYYEMSQNEEFVDRMSTMLQQMLTTMK